MTLHRFYVGGIKDKSGELQLAENVWVHDSNLIRQWLKVLRLKIGDEIILFNDDVDRLYKISAIEKPNSIGLHLVTELARNVPTNKVYLLWSLLKKDKNEWVLQKATELGVTNFVPIIAQRSEKDSINFERAKKILVEAAEQCGRSDIPDLREPITLAEALTEYSTINLVVAERSEEESKSSFSFDNRPTGILVGPEGGWTDEERALFKASGCRFINIAMFTLRAETAAIVATAKILQ